MNDYYQVRIDATPCNETVTDILASMLADTGYESFVPDENGLTAFIKADDYTVDAVNAITDNFPMDGYNFSVKAELVEGRDWNEEWEKNYFQPIVIDDQCVIHSSFHTDFPHCKYDIVIDPKMAFGTGHHSTTSLIVRRLLQLDIDGKDVIDMGTGTGILAILAAMRGAAHVDAVEIDSFAYENAVENVKLNNHPEINVINSDASALANLAPADLFIANINRNVILADLPAYAKAMKPYATLLLSGFYEADINMILDAASPCHLEYMQHTVDNGWVCLQLQLNYREDQK